MSVQSAKVPVVSLIAEPKLIQQDLYFRQNLPKGGEFSQQKFQVFVDNVITPRFPAGLTIFDANRQFHDPSTPSKENTKVVSLFVEGTLESEAAINEIIEAYSQQFQGAAVKQVTNKDDLKVGFGVDEDLIDNDVVVPELIEVDLLFGRNIARVGEVSQQEFQDFLDNVITPRFPAGLTVFDTNGQFQDSTGEIVEEPSKAVRLILEDTETNEAAINEIVEAYIQQFQQESVLQAVNEDVTVSFGPTDNLIDNDPIPELIQANLFFGRNIAGVGEVTQEQFQAFLDNIVAPRFPGLTVFDANGQFKDSMGTIVEEQSKVVNLIFEDTEQNEAYISDILETYIKQFQQESILIVVDEDIQANFTASAVKVAIPIENAGFEIPALEDGTFTAGYSQCEPLSGWQPYYPNDLVPGISFTPENVTVTGIGVVNPLAAQYPQQAPEGNNVGYAYAVELFSSGVFGLSQTLDTLLATNTQYTLEDATFSAWDFSFV